MAVATLLLWSSLGADDGISGVLARRGEVVARRFIEVPCSEDYDGHQRFEGTQPGLGVTQVLAGTWDIAEPGKALSPSGSCGPPVGGRERAEPPVKAQHPGCTEPSGLPPAWTLPHHWCCFPSETVPWLSKGGFPAAGVESHVMGW